MKNNAGSAHKADPAFLPRKNCRWQCVAVPMKACRWCGRKPLVAVIRTENNRSLVQTRECRGTPKGSSFDGLVQDQINLMMSHINSYSRQSLHDKTPYEMFAFLYGNEALDSLLRLLCLTVIPPDDITLKPSILFSV